MAVTKKPGPLELHDAASKAITGQLGQNLPDTYRVVDFVKAVAMHDDRGMEVRVNRVRTGAPVDRESPMRVASIVLNGAWFDITASTGGEDGNCFRYRVHVTNTVSAER